MAHAKGYQYAIYCGNLLSNIWGGDSWNKQMAHACRKPSRPARISFPFPFPFLSLSFLFPFPFLSFSFAFPFLFLSLFLVLSFCFPCANCPLCAKA